ncbi:hypothetical protein JOL62DRAFT_567903 [Phyllosticta paracitricarpa]|uniref:Fe2OG dioxygenase domain-containing protein n=1 Tax=Phyllosticta paracitricarpa TaxID=2016321 RepID=A0ABR1NDS0_9PEZI
MTGTKRTLDAFFQPMARKKSKINESDGTATTCPPLIATSSNENTRNQRLGVEVSPSAQPPDARPPPPSTHHTYPHPIAALPSPLQSALATATPFCPARAITNGPALDLLYFEPFIPRRASDDLFRLLRASLPFYRVHYTINRGGSGPVDVTTPRYTTVFGVDDSCVFGGPPGSNDNNNAAAQDASNAEKAPPLELLDAKTRTPVPSNRYARAPRPLPASLAALRDAVQRATGHTFNFCLVNYYATGADSISMHSDDEKFLGRDPAIASLSLGARRDFVMKHKLDRAAPTLKLPLAGGDMVLMRGTTQGAWLHGVPKRSAKTVGEVGRINITFRKAIVRGGTENYYRYNVGDGECWRWDERKGEMVVWKDKETEDAQKG